MTDRNDRKDRPGIDPALLRGLTQRRISRRDLLRYAGVGAGSLSLASILAACSGGGGGDAVGGGGGGGGGGEQPQIDWNAEPSGTLDFANWPLYIDQEKRAGETVYPSIVQFTKDTGIQVNYRTVIQGNTSFFGKIQPQLQSQQPTGYDIIVITNGETLTRLIELDYLIELPTDKRPNFDQYAGTAWKDPAFDPGNKYSMAWQSGLTGIGWDPKQVAELRPDNPEITSAMDLFDPAFAGKVGMFADTADMPNTALIALGYNPEESTPDQWQEAADLLSKQRDDGVVRQYYEQNYINALSNGDVAVTQGWSGDIFQTNLSGDAEGLQFTVPDEGVIIWTDNMLIPKGAEHPVDAITYMDYVYDPDVAGQIAQWVNYITPVPESKEFVLGVFEKTGDTYYEDVANSPLVYPTQEEMDRFYTYRVLTEDEQLEWNALFQPIYQA
jgi:spermidine/putrescine transport system substrate-binding protein